MIKATELRIGNIILLNDDGVWTERIIHGIGKDKGGFTGYFVDFGWATCSLEDLFNDGELSVKGVPLTEEWLKKLGMEYHDKPLDRGSAHLQNVVARWEHEEKFEYVIDSPSGDIDYLYVTKEVDYVHQLQNLYFALTGEELTIK